MMKDEEEVQTRKLGFENAGFFTRITMLFVQPVMKKGYVTTL